MPGPFFGVESGLRALRTAQAAMDTASHNIANVNTPGYSRQRVEYQVTDPYTVPSQWYKIGALQIGTGIQARAITQARDNALDGQVRAGYSDREALIAQQGALTQVEEAIGEPGANGLNAAMTRLFNTFHDLANNAESAPLRSAVVASAGTLTSTFRQVHERLQNVQEGLDTRINFGVSEINGIAKQIATLNTEIRKVLAQGDQPNDLRDQRNNLLDALAKKANATVIPAADGTLTVQVGGVALVRGTADYPLAGLSDLTANGDLVSGEMKGLLDARARVTVYQNNLDGLAATFISQVNTLHQGGLDKTGAAGVALFTGTGASDIAINPLVAANPDRIAAAAAPTPPATFAVGNGDNALAIADLAGKKITSGAVSNQSLRDFWGGAASTLGVEVKTLNGNVSGHDAFVKQLEGRREAISGVSLDDEMADLIKFQRAYQAAAKLISISDEMTATLINAFGR
jgi:flagellar hook-associated protein 1 FlgK